MRVLVTGFNARTASPKRATRDTCFAALLVTALRDMGITVDHRDTKVGEPVDDYDHVFVGVASPLAVSSNRTYPALSTIGLAWAAMKCTFFLDDPDVSKIPHGLASLGRKPDQFLKPFFATRMDYSAASDPAWESYLRNVAHVMLTGEWPRLLVPAFSWADLVPMLATLPNTMQGNAVAMDLSAFMPDLAVPPISREEHWFTEEPFNSKWIRNLHLSRPVKHLGRVWDEQRIVEYAGSWGVLEESLAPHASGWFRPKMVMAMRAGAVYITRWEGMVRVGTEFTLLPHVVEVMTYEERGQLAYRQRQRFTELQWTRERVKHTLRDILGITEAAESVS